MKATFRILVTLTAAMAAALAGVAAAQDAGPQRLAYPQARRTDFVDTYHGVKVADPYRWMEELDSPETRAWVEAESKLTTSYLEAIPGRAAIAKRLTDLWNYERCTVPFVRGQRTFFTCNSGLQQQNVLYVVDKPGTEPRTLLDPNGLSKDGTVALAGTSVSDDGRLLAYGLSSAGSDWQVWQVRDVASLTDLPDRLEWIKFSRPAWLPDGSGLYYGRFDKPAAGAELKQANYFQKLALHKLGTAQTTDPVVYERPDHKDWQFGAQVTDDGRYLIVDVTVGSDERTMVFYAELGKEPVKVVELLPAFDARYTFVDNDGPVFFFRTDLDAPRGRVVAVDTRHPERSAWREVIGQQADTLVRVSLVHDTFVASYLKDATTAVRLFTIDGKDAGTIPLPGLGSAMGFGGKRADALTYYSFRSYTTPETVFSYDFRTSKSAVFRQPHLKADLERYETKQVFYASKDGTKVPMFLTCRKGLKLDGSNPVLLTAYGGFDIPTTPSFAVPNLVWLELGGVYAAACLRGGGEYGEAWHEAGMKEKKQNVFDDFIAAAEWLVANHYTVPAKLAIYGRSNGGLLIGAVENQRPDLFGATIPGVGVMDMLRYHSFTIGWAWRSEYGTSDDPTMFPVLLKYSPLHNIRPGTHYPPTLVLTADHDDRVIPAHSFKYAATLQAAQGGDAPVLIRIEPRAGHGGASPTAKLIAEATDRLAFIANALKVKVEL